MICVELPFHLRTLARVAGEVELHVEGTVTQRAVLDALEAAYPVLRGAIRDHATQERRPYLRFFACGQDCPTSRRTPRSPTRSRWGSSHFWSWGPSQAVSPVSKETVTGKPCR